MASRGHGTHTAQASAFTSITALQWLTESTLTTMRLACARSKTTSVTWISWNAHSGCFRKRAIGANCRRAGVLFREPWSDCGPS